MSFGGPSKEEVRVAEIGADIEEKRVEIAKAQVEQDRRNRQSLVGRRSGTILTSGGGVSGSSLLSEPLEL